MLLTSGEIKRTRARFILLTVGAGLLVFVLLFQQLLLDGVLTGLTGAVRNQSGLVVVFRQEAKRSIQGGFAAPVETQQAIAANPDVAAVSELKLTSAPFRSSSGSTIKDAMIFGYKDGQPGMPDRLVAGRMPQSPTEIVADRESAAGTYDVGSDVVIEPGGLNLTVVGLTQDARFNVSPTFWVDTEGYAQVVQASQGVDLGAQVVVVQPQDGVSATALASQLGADFPDLDIVTRQVAADSAPGIGEIRLMFGMILGLCYLVVGIVIAFFFLTLTLQKKSSLTLLRAVGAPNGYLVRSLLQQVLLVTLGGVGVGLLLLVGSVPLISATVPLTLRASTIGACAVMALGVALLGAIPPMRRILRTDPFDVVGRPSLGGLG